MGRTICTTGFSGGLQSCLLRMMKLRTYVEEVVNIIKQVKQLDGVFDSSLTSKCSILLVNLPQDLAALKQFNPSAKLVAARDQLQIPCVTKRWLEECVLHNRTHFCSWRL